MRRKYRVVLATACALLLPQAVARPDWGEPEKTRCRSAKTLRIMISCTPGIAAKKQKQINDEVVRMFGHCGIQVVDAEAREADVTLRIPMKAESSATTYFDHSGRARRLSTGASVNGEICVSLGKTEVLRRAFRGTELAPGGIWASPAGPEPLDIEPYGKALVQSGSLMPELLRLVAEAYGVEAAIESGCRIKFFGEGKSGPYVAMTVLTQAEVIADVSKGRPAVLFPCIRQNEYAHEPTYVAGVALATIARVKPPLNSDGRISSDIEFVSTLADAIGKIGDRNGVPVLIGMLQWKTAAYAHTARQSVMNALTMITAENAGDDVTKWKEWWEKNRSQYPRYSECRDSERPLTDIPPSPTRSD